MHCSRTLSVITAAIVLAAPVAAQAGPSRASCLTDVFAPCAPWDVINAMATAWTIGAASHPAKTRLFVEDGELAPSIEAAGVGDTMAAFWTEPRDRTGARTMWVGGLLMSTGAGLPVPRAGQTARELDLRSLVRVDLTVSGITSTGSDAKRQGMPRWEDAVAAERARRQLGGM